MPSLENHNQSRQRNDSRAYRQETRDPADPCSLDGPVSNRPDELLFEADHLHGLGLGEAGYDEPSLMFLAGTNTQWFRTGTLLGNWMKQHPGNVAIVEARELKAFTRTDPAVVQVGEVDGFDYSNGKWVKIEVLR